MLLGYEDGKARLWDVPAGRLRCELRHGAYVRAVAISPDGQTLLTGSLDRTARLWRADNGEPIGKEPLAHAEGVGTVAFSADGNTVLAASTDGTARLWDAATGAARTAPLKHATAVTGAAFVSEGRVLTADRAGLLRLWDAAAGSLVKMESNYGIPIETLAINPADPVAAVLGTDARVSLWSTRTLAAVGVLPAPPGELTAVAFSADGHTLLTYGKSNDVLLWDVATRRLLGQPLSHGQRIGAALFLPGSAGVLSASYDGTIRRWDLAPAARPQQSLPHAGRLLAAAFSPDGRWFATAGEVRDPGADHGGEARLWDVANGRLLTILPHPRAVGAVAVAGADRLVSGCDDGVARFWSIHTGQPTATEFNPGDALGRKEVDSPINALAVSPDGVRVATGSHDGLMCLWSAATGPRRVAAEPVPRLSSVNAIAFDPRGETFLLANGERRLWRLDAKTGVLAGEPWPSPDEILSLAFDVRGDAVVTGGKNGTARLWQIATGRPTGPALHHGDEVRGVAFSPDGRWIVTAGTDRTAQLWLVPAGQPIGPRRYHRAAVNAVAWSPRGDVILTACGDEKGGTACLWKVPVPVAGTAAEAMQRVEVLTGLRLDEDESAQVLSRSEWEDRRRLDAAVP